MTEQYLGWALIAGTLLGAAITWFIMGRLPRRSDDVERDERAEEARWISDTIEARGGYIPPDLVDEILDLHNRYLYGPPLDLRATPPERRPWPPVTERSPAGEEEERADARPPAPEAAAAETPAEGVEAEGRANVELTESSADRAAAEPAVAEVTPPAEPTTPEGERAA